MLPAMAFEGTALADKEKSVPRGTHAPIRVPGPTRDVGSELADWDFEKRFLTSDTNGTSSRVPMARYVRPENISDSRIETNQNLP